MRRTSSLPFIVASGLLGLLAPLVYARAQKDSATTPVATGAIEGTVYDSLLTKAPLRGATVYLVGTTLIAQTDSLGRFSLAAVPAGAHTLTFAHPRFDSAGVQAPQVAVSVPAGTTTRVAVATPRGASLVKAICAGPRGEQTGLLLGTVHDADSGRPLIGARIASRWFELTIDNKGPHYATLQTSAVSDNAGAFRLCGVPADIPVFVRATSGQQESGRVELYFSGADVLFQDFIISVVDSAARVIDDSPAQGSTDSLNIAGPRGTAIVRGIVKDPNGKPLADVHVGVLDRFGTKPTDADGRFSLGDVPAGTQTLELRAVGFTPMRRTVALRTGTPTEIVVSLDRAVQPLNTVRVVGDQSASRYSRTGFEDRRRRGVGFFIDAEEITRKGGIYLGDILRLAPGVFPNYTQRGRTFTMRATFGGEQCSPTYYLDGTRWFAIDKNPILELEQFIQLHDVYAVEVYASGARTPAQFDAHTDCGSVVFWTKR